MQRRRSLTPASHTKADGKKVSARSVAQYIAERTRDLAALAGCIGCADLAYLLEVATIEAESMGDAPEACCVSEGAASSPD